MFYVKLSYTILLCDILSYSSLSLSLYIYIYIFSYHPQVEGEVLDLALVTNYSQSPILRGLLLARCHYLHRSDIVWVGHPTMYRTWNVNCSSVSSILNEKNSEKVQIPVAYPEERTFPEANRSSKRETIRDQVVACAGSASLVLVSGSRTARRPGGSRKRILPTKPKISRLITRRLIECRSSCALSANSFSSRSGLASSRLASPRQLAQPGPTTTIFVPRHFSPLFPSSVRP